MIPHLDISILVHADIALARRAAVQVVSDHHLDESERGRIAAIVTELATNLVTHAIDGRMLIGCHATGNGAQFEVLVLDSGSVQHDPSLQLSDEIAANAQASRFALVRRLSTDFASFSVPGKGTVTLSRAWAPSSAVAAAVAPSARFSHVGIGLAKLDEQSSSAAWHIDIERSSARILVVEPRISDVDSARTSAVITEAFKTSRNSLSEFLSDAHRLTREGSVISAVAASIDCARGRILFAGTGDLTVRIVSTTDARGDVPNSVERLT